MGVLGFVTIGLCVVWAIPSFRDIARRRSRAPSAEKDKSSLLVVMLANYLSIGFALFIKLAPAVVGGVGAISSVSPYMGYFGCAVMVVGMVIRWTAIATLKNQFTIDVAVVENHQLVDRGLYSVIRHPAYLGGQLTMLGLGLALENWVSLASLVILPLAGHLYRMSVEEKVLVRHFGQSYADYMKRTKRLIPGVY